MKTSRGCICFSSVIGGTTNMVVGLASGTLKHIEKARTIQDRDSPKIQTRREADMELVFRKVGPEGLEPPTNWV